jgi:hypothetical protein
MRGRTLISNISRTGLREFDPKMQSKPSIAKDAISTCGALGQSYGF